MNNNMETNKYLWQPRNNGPIHIRVQYKDAKGKLKQFTRSLNTSHLPTARKIRDTEFLPIIYDIKKAEAQLDLILQLYPELQKKLQVGVHGGYGVPEVKKSTPLKKVIQAWSKAMAATGNYFCSEGTRVRYTSIVTLFLEMSGEEIDLFDVTKETVITFRDQRLQDHGKSKKTVSLDITALRGMFAFAMEKFGLETNPANGVLIKRTKAESNRENRMTKRRPPTKDEADALCYNFPGHDRSQYSIDDYQDYALFCRYTGCRQGEVAQIRKDDFYLLDAEQYTDEYLNLPQSCKTKFTGQPIGNKILCLIVADKEEQSTKSGLERIVPIAEKLMPTFKRRFEQAKSGQLFPFAYKDKGASFGRTWLKKAKKIEDGLTMHGFRHYVTSQMENTNCKTAVVCLITGHTKGDVHDGYFHKQVHLLKSAIDTIY